MFLTTFTTAAAFFGTAICPVAPVRLFAIFCGLLILFDYIMDVALIFPCLCIYDGYRENPNCCITCQSCRKKPEDTLVVDSANTTQIVTKDGGTDETLAFHTDEIENSDSGDNSSGKEVPDSESDCEHEKPIRISLIRRILLAYYNFLHMVRWPLLVASTIAFCVCLFYASKLELPTSSDVRILSPSVEFEQAYEWRLNILYDALLKQGGSQAITIWGVRPADTGDQNNPESWSTLVLDETFDPSTPEVQIYLRDYCPRYFAEDFAELPQADFECSMNKFDKWLQGEHDSVKIGSNATDSVYLEYCQSATGLPMKQDAFHACMSAWSKVAGESYVLEWDNVVKVIFFPFNSRVRYDSPNSELDDEWNLIDQWMKTDQETAPPEAANAFFSSEDFWWYDTNIQMFR